MRGPAHGLPVLLKDLIDVKGMYTSAGNFSLRNSFPAIDSGVAKKLRENGVVILGKLGLSEYANYFGSQPSGFANLTGQVLNAHRRRPEPVSGSSSGSGSAGAAALSMLIVGTETSGSIISPSQANGLVGLRPTVGLVPGYGIAPISASQDTAGPMDRTVANAAMTLQSIAGYDPHNADYYKRHLGPGHHRRRHHPARPGHGPELHVRAGPELRARQADRLQRHADRRHAAQAGQRRARRGRRDHGRAPGASARPAFPAACSATRPSATSTPTTAHLGPDAPIKTAEQEMADNQANAHEALKFGNGTHASAFAIDITPDSPASVAYRNDVLVGKRLSHSGIDRMMTNDTPADPSDDFIAILGSVANGARARLPAADDPDGLQRRPSGARSTSRSTPTRTRSAT